MKLGTCLIGLSSPNGKTGLSRDTLVISAIPPPAPRLDCKALRSTSKFLVSAFSSILVLRFFGR
ncbi:hypothetical protein BO83DRAFT_9519 [Aspergillus eucalypticola CBS 122712]|uniref:Uncharacterized protein n=1 Tax=Aspergillus eucalypticola (strain CBS 122712 / IBT 29274) TaxID=1448314 RepID=A0A317WHJ2_ASPEC|nr:uncharacterized protein BO83DRAFT_9519 [Aspergillus eucalypticola CBS 122712]PWY85515.1 hypothetical protein BO83DRAFT_9519 [Aspergillus eucalypticola CBS 122712]